MISHIKQFREKMDNGIFCVCGGVSFSDSSVSEILSMCMDCLWIDMEHTPLGLESMQNHLIAARAGGAPTLVRVPSTDVAWVKRALDSGAEGVIMPRVRDAEDVKQYVSACRYPPMGTRGFGPRRASAYGRTGVDDYLQQANKNIFVCAQIEWVSAVDDLDAILAVPGLDSLVVGPYDLSGSMGILGQVSSPQVTAAIEKVVSKTREAGLYVGIGMGPDKDHALWARDAGFHWVQCGNDYNYLAQYADQLVAAIRS